MGCIPAALGNGQKPPRWAAKPCGDGFGMCPQDEDPKKEKLSGATTSPGPSCHRLRPGAPSPPRESELPRLSDIKAVRGA